MPFHFISIFSVHTPYSLFTLDFEFLSITVRALNGLDLSSATAFHTFWQREKDEAYFYREWKERVAKLIAHPPLSFFLSLTPISFVLFRCLQFCFGNALCLTVSMTFKLIQLKHLISINGVYIPYELFLLLHLSNQRDKRALIITTHIFNSYKAWTGMLQIIYYIIY